MPEVIPHVVMRKDVPKSTNFLDNDVGQIARRGVVEAHKELKTRIENDKITEEQRLGQRIAEARRIDLIA